MNLRGCMTQINFDFVGLSWNEWCRMKFGFTCAAAENSYSQILSESIWANVNNLYYPIGVRRINRDLQLSLQRTGEYQRFFEWFGCVDQNILATLDWALVHWSPNRRVAR